MEEKRLILETKTKQLNEEVEDLLETDQLKRKVATTTTINQTIKYRGMWITVDEETFKEKVENEGGEYSFVALFNNEEQLVWYIKEDYPTQVVDLSEYGITITGDEVREKDEITVVFFDDIKYYGYLQADKLVDTKEYNFISFSSELDVRLELARNTPEFVHMVTRRTIIDCPQHSESDIWIFNSERKDFDIKLILAVYEGEK